MDIKAVISRTMSYLLLFLGIIFSIYGAYYYLPFPFFTVAVISILWILYGESTRQKLQTGLDQKWIEDWYDPVLFMQTISSRLIPVLDRDKLFQIIRDAFINTIKISFVSIYLAQRDSKNNIKYYEKIKNPIHSKNENIERGQNDSTDIETRGSEKLMAKEMDLQTVMQESKIMRLTDENLIKQFNQPEFEKNKRNLFLLPIHSSTQFEGFLVLGPKVSEAPFTKTDLSIFDSFSKQAQLVLDRIQPYEKIKINYEKSLKVAQEATIHKNFATLTKQISHEIRNPMLGINLAAESAKEELLSIPESQQEKEMVSEFLASIIDDVNRVTKVTDTMLKYGYSESREKQEININTAIENTLNLSKTKGFEEKIKLIRNMDNTIPKIIGDEARLHQVFLNLVLNAIQAMEDGGGTLTVNTNPDSFVDKHGIRKRAVRVDIKDTGVGMDNEQRQRIFDPFFTTKHLGTGLGLSIVFGIVDDHGGIIDVSSQKGAGSVFSVFLPV
ncbi:nitrogen regulation protein NR(II) [Thermoproteota archaeon]